VKRVSSQTNEFNQNMLATNSDRKTVNCLSNIKISDLTLHGTIEKLFKTP